MDSVLVIGSGNAFSSNGRAQACFLLQSGAEHLLLDCGATSLMQMQRLGVDVDSLDRLLVTHFHGDHTGGIPFLLIHFEYITRRRHPFELLGPPGLREAVQRLFDAMYPGIKLSYEVRYVELHEGKLQKTGQFTIESIPVLHRPESLGYRITGCHGRSFSFSGDTGWCESLERLYDDVDAGLLELSLERQPEGGTSHMSLEEVILKRPLLRARRLFFSHIYDELAARVLEYASTHPGFGHPVHDGMKIPFYEMT
jgi:ribonuclease BN (tRNA processing enzyme)